MESSGQEPFLSCAACVIHDLSMLLLSQSREGDSLACSQGLDLQALFLGTYIMST